MSWNLCDCYLFILTTWKKLKQHQPLPSRNLELQPVQRHKSWSWQWAPALVPIDLYRSSVAALSHWPPEVCPLWSCCRQHPPSRLWCTFCGPRVCSCWAGWAARRCWAGRCHWAAMGDQRRVKTNYKRIGFCFSKEVLCRRYAFDTFRSMISFSNPS